MRSLLDWIRDERIQREKMKLLERFLDVSERERDGRGSKKKEKVRIMQREDILRTDHFET